MMEVSFSYLFQQLCSETLEETIMLKNKSASMLSGEVTLLNWYFGKSQVILKLLPKLRI